MMITVAICTYNNANVLDLTLSSICDLDVPCELEYEILVVDNNCSDHTSEIVEKHSGIFSNLRVVKESKQGLSHARNRALEEAKGEIVSFIDDDVKVDSGWLAAVANAFETYNAALVGGKSYLIYPCDRPSWITDRFESLLSRLDYGDEVLVGTDKELYGLNFAVLKKTALAVGGFNCELGRKGKRLLSGEEKELQDKILKTGGVAVYEPRAVVGHIVIADRLRKRWFLRRIFWGGVSAERQCIREENKIDWQKNVGHAVRCTLSIVKSWFLLDFSQRTLLQKSFWVASAYGKLYEDLAWKVRINK